jgi:putative MATE family efflux protein
VAVGAADDGGVGGAVGEQFSGSHLCGAFRRGGVGGGRRRQPVAVFDDGIGDGGLDGRDGDCGADGRRERYAQPASGGAPSAGIACILGVAFTLLGYLLLPQIIRWYGLEAGADAQARQFLTLALLGAPASFLMMGLSGTFRGLGDTRSPMYASIVATVVHIVGDYLLIFGKLGLPALGIRGAGIAMALSLWAGAGMLWAQLWFSRRRELAYPALPVWSWWKRILRIGLPASARTFIYSTSSVMFTGILAATAAGTAAVAALPIGLTAESIAFMPGFAFAIAASALVGQALGAKNERLAERFGWTAAWQSCAVMTTMAVVFYLFAEQFAGLFTTDPQVKALAVAYFAH